MQAYAACDDPDVRAVAPQGATAGWSSTSRRSPAFASEEVRNFFAVGMLLNVIASMELLDSKEKWAGRMLEGLRHK